jgi:hypothetical protein
MSKNIGFTKNEAEWIAKQLAGYWDKHGDIHADALQESHFKPTSDVSKMFGYTHEYIVVLRKRRDSK